MISCPVGSIRTHQSDPIVKTVIDQVFPAEIDALRIPGVGVMSAIPLFSSLHFHTCVPSFVMCACDFISGDAPGLPLCAVVRGDSVLHPAARREHHDRLAQIQRQVSALPARYTSLCMYECMYDV